MTDQIAVHTTYSVRFTDLPANLKSMVGDLADEWEIRAGQLIEFAGLLEFYEDDADNMDKFDAIKDFMNKNDLEDSYCIDLDW